MGQYFEEQPNSKSNIKLHTEKILGKEYYFYTDHGVFSYDGLDHATSYLIDSLPMEKLSGKILDFGCGYGPIGIVIKDKTNCVVDMIDINERAIELAKKNALENNVDVNIYKSDIYENVNSKYNFIITNPPIRVGKKILYQILFEAENYLLDNGELWLVISKNQGAKSLIKNLENTYEVEIINKIKSFYIICCKKR